MKGGKLGIVIQCCLASHINKRHLVFKTTLQSKIRSHLQSIGEGQAAFDSLHHLESLFTRKIIEESSTKQTKVNNFFRPFFSYKSVSLLK